MHRSMLLWCFETINWSGLVFWLGMDLIGSAFVDT